MTATTAPITPCDSAPHYHTLPPQRHRTLPPQRHHTLLPTPAYHTLTHFPTPSVAAPPNIIAQRTNKNGTLPRKSCAGESTNTYITLELFAYKNDVVAASKCHAVR